MGYKNSETKKWKKFDPQARDKSTVFDNKKIKTTKKFCLFSYFNVHRIFFKKVHWRGVHGKNVKNITKCMKNNLPFARVRWTEN